MNSSLRDMKLTNPTFGCLGIHSSMSSASLGGLFLPLQREGPEKLLWAANGPWAPCYPARHLGRLLAGLGHISSCLPGSLQQMLAFLRGLDGPILPTVWMDRGEETEQAHWLKPGHFPVITFRSPRSIMNPHHSAILKAQSSKR